MVMNKFIVWMTVCLLALTFCSCGSEEVAEPDLKTIRDCRELEVAEFNFHKIIVERSSLKLISMFGHGIGTPEKTLILPVDLKVAGTVDLSGVTQDNIVRDGDNLIFILPDPTLRILSLKLDHDTRDRASREQWWRGGSFSDEDIRRIAAQAKDSIMTDRALAMMTERTRANAASVLIPLIAETTGVSTENITVRFDSAHELNAATADRLKDGNTDLIIFRRKE